MPNINDVAQRAGVSASTARRAIFEPERLTKITLEKVQKAIRELNYEPDRMAGSLRRGHSLTVGLMVASIVEPFFAQLSRIIANALRDRGYTLVIAENQYDSDLELQNLRMFHGERVSALIIRSAFGKGNLEYLSRMKEQGTFIVEIDNFVPGSPFSHIMLDNFACVEKGLNYLYELGHRQIAPLMLFDHVRFQDERASAFRDVMKSYGLRAPEPHRGTLEQITSAKFGYARTLELMRLKNPPSAIFSLTGHEAVGAFRAIKHLGLRIPEDVSLLSFDDIEWMSLVEPQIDAIAQPIEVMGLAAVDTALQAIESRDLSISLQKRFPGKLLKRGSCAAVSTELVR